MTSYLLTHLHLSPVRNIRTCCEYGCKQIYVVCRKRNLTCPRVVSWFINQAAPAITGRHCLELLQVAYKLCRRAVDAVKMDLYIHIYIRACTAY